MYKCIVCGNLTADPILSERKWTNQETGEIVSAKVCNFTVAANNGYGESRQTQFFRVNVWRKQAEICGEYLKKGRQVLVEGPVTLNNYVDKNNNLRTVMEVRAEEVQFLGGRVVDAPAEQPVELDDADVPY